ncbi:FAD-binding oxidoreductase [Pseudarthrobacter albicanus]|uniref:FAD-binding oxidoreductase n=1 Tax=Pseudarthrobacter albicanus TaxID=2823873 RepID=UPI001BA8A498|nr:FAD-binding oxidoreductase [Pseudarthrobacter albicanus]
MPDLDDAVSAFRESFGGEVIAPSDAGYDQARSVWNGDIDRRPALIVRPSGAPAVAQAITFARGEGLEVSVRGGGHSYAGHGVCDGGLMIDLSRLDEIAVDAPARRVRCGGGTTWGQLDAATQEHSLAVTGGFISTTGVGGLTLGGGMGWLTARAGLSCDNLVSAEIVTADGRTVTASQDDNPELFWALRGGGGNFGIVTTFEFALHDVPQLTQLGMFFWDVEHGREGLRFSRDLVRSLPDDMGSLIAGLSAPEAPFVPAEYQGKPGFAVLVAGWGTPEEHAAAVAPVQRMTSPPQWQLITPVPYVQLQQMFNEDSPWGVYNYEKALYLDELSDEAIDIFVDQLPRKTSPLSFVPVFPLSGAFSRTDDQATAFGGSRNGAWVFNISATCSTPELLDKDREWVRDFWKALRPQAASSGGYVNFLTEADQDRVRISYGPEKYDQLARIKAAWDPENVFHRNANIRPAAGTPAAATPSSELA